MGRIGIVIQCPMVRNKKTMNMQVSETRLNTVSRVMRGQDGYIVVDNFAGGGGASTGIEIAIGRSVDIAINHDEDAITMHKMNHPDSEHYCEDVWDVCPVKASAGRPVGLAWFSSDCTHFSKARGKTPVKKNIRGLSWVALRWALLVSPRCVMLENVEEITTWGPVVDGYPCPDRKGETFEAFISAFQEGLSPKHGGWLEMVRSLGVEYDIQAKLKLYRGLGYKLEHRELRASDYGAPTIRKRFFLVARCDGEDIVWPKPTHAKDGVDLPKWRSAASIIDWEIPCKSIMGRQRLLADKTMERIALGLWKYVIAQKPFIAPTTAGIISPFITEHANASAQRNMSVEEPLRTQCASVKGGHFALVSPILIGTGGPKYSAKPKTVAEPLNTIPATNHSALVGFVAKHYTGVVGSSLQQPLATVTSVDHNALVTAYIKRDFGRSVGHSVSEPMATLTTSGGGKASLVCSHMIKLRNGNVGYPSSEACHTITAGGLHQGEVRSKLQACSELTDDELYSAWWVARLIDTYVVKEKRLTQIPFPRISFICVGDYIIIDVGMRMLVPRELFNAHDFPRNYIIDVDPDGKKIPKTKQVARVGNSVPPPLVTALVMSNLPDLCERQEVAA